MQLIGTLGGIGEMAREVMGDGARSRKGDVTTPLELDRQPRASVPRTDSR